MMEMHFFKRTRQVEISSPKERKEATAQDLFYFLFEICAWSQACPLVHRGGQEGEGAIYLLFRNFAFSGDDFWQIFGPYFSMINSRWRLDAFGTSCSSQETVWFNLEEKDGHCYGVQNTVSGDEAELISSLCLRVGCSFPEQGDALEDLMKSADWKKGILVADWKYHEFFEKEEIENHWENSRFCYASLVEDALPGDFLHALTFRQKTALWAGFLKDGFDYKEFEWLYGMISEDAVENRIEWELALHTAMEELGYTIEVSEHEFELYDAKFRRKYLNFNSRQYAQMALLKILFPVIRADRK